MVIKVIGSGCDNCRQAYENVCEVVKADGIDAQIERVTDLIEIVKLGVMQVPSIMVDGKLVIVGQVPTTEQIRAALN